ncbi:hypothetical protein R5R35_003327 [Gryllus longicercus]|uniref:Chemosensory protein n=1 Tax=Gryllus longicercus TaxID=2509291 RepID=A0AAN9VHD7_9ORTH
MSRLALSLLALALLALAARAAEPKYTNKFDNIDIDRILGNERVLTSYIRCMMEEGPCTNEGRELRKTLPDALKTGCTKCNEKQKTLAEKVIKHLTAARKADWERLAAKYDPEGLYKQRYAELLATVTPPSA